MILLLGGAAETGRLAAALAETGFDVLVSTATDIPLSVAGHPKISRRAGPLDADGMAALIRNLGIGAVVDATHPYASRAHEASRVAASRAGVPLLSFIRPPAVREGDGARVASGHEEAARMAASFGLPILLTIGSRNVLPYARAAGLAKVPLIARVLPHPGSIETCRRAGLPEECIIAMRGPYSVEENRSLVARHGIGVLVTKDGGVEGGVREKIEAARLEGCRVVVVGRPARETGNAFHRIQDLIDCLLEIGPPGAAIPRYQPGTRRPPE